MAVFDHEETLVKNVQVYHTVQINARSSFYSYSLFSKFVPCAMGHYRIPSSIMLNLSHRAFSNLIIHPICKSLNLIVAFLLHSFFLHSFDGSVLNKYHAASMCHNSTRHNFKVDNMYKICSLHDSLFQQNKNVMVMDVIVEKNCRNHK